MIRTHTLLLLSLMMLVLPACQAEENAATSQQPSSSTGPGQVEGADNDTGPQDAAPNADADEINRIVAILAHDKEAIFFARRGASYLPVTPVSGHLMESYPPQLEVTYADTAESESLFVTELKLPASITADQFILTLCVENACESMARFFWQGKQLYAQSSDNTMQWVPVEISHARFDPVGVK